MSKLDAFFKTCPIPSREMDEETLRSMMVLRLDRRLAEPLTHKEFLEDPAISSKSSEQVPAVFKAFWKRIKDLNEHFRLSIDALTFMALFTESFRPDVVVYLSYAISKAKEAGVRDITLDFLSTNVYMFGVFSPEEISVMWEAQKNEGSPQGNLLDDMDEWKTYLFGPQTEDSVFVRFSDEDERWMTPQEVVAIGPLKDPREIDGRTFFWAGKQYLSVATEDFIKLQDK